MDIQFPSHEVLQYISSYDRINASFTGKEAARVDWIMLPEGYTWKWVLAIAVLSTLSFASWRLWTFTIRPWIHPDEPREIPYWIPCHSMDFFRNSHGLITGAKTSMSDDEPYSLTMAGERYYILTTPQDAATTFRRSQALVWEPYLKRLMVQFGVRPSSLPKIWDPPEPGNPRRSNPLNPKTKSLIHYGEDMYKRQLSPGPNLDSFTYRLAELLNTSLQWRQLSTLCTSEQKIPLLDLSAHIHVDSMTRCLFGDSIYEIEPRLTQMLYDYSEEAWKHLMFPHPKFAVRHLHTAKEGIYDALVRYMRISSERRTETAWFWGEILKEQEASHLDVYDGAGIIFMLTWAANINVYRLTHWVLSYVLCDSELLNIVKAEIQPAFRHDDVDYRHIYENCPRLTAVYTELLRLTFGSFSVRKIATPVVMGSKKLRSNSSIILPIRALHYNSKVFGENADQFNATRFLDNSLDKNPSFRPFAGGITYCPGRFLAKRQTLILVAILLYRYDIELSGGSMGETGVCRPPRIDQDGPSLGIMGPVKETQLVVKLKQAVR